MIPRSLDYFVLALAVLVLLWWAYDTYQCRREKYSPVYAERVASRDYRQYPLPNLGPQ